MASRGLLRIVLIVALLPLVIPPVAHGDTTIVVSSTEDSIGTSGYCTLREAVIAANTDAAVGGCLAGSGADTIVLPAGIYVLSLTGPGDNGARTGDLDLRGEVTIRGGGAAETIIDGGGWRDADALVQDRVLHVLSRANVTLSGVTVRNGVCARGCGILNDGVLLVEDSRVEGNSAWPGPQGKWSSGAGIWNGGRLTMVRSSLSFNAAGGPFDDTFTGGGLLNGAWARLERTEVAGNYAASGSGIENSGSLEMIDSTIAGNGSRFWGAGMENLGIARLTRTTVAGNADGAIINGYWQGTTKGHLVLQDSTVSGNRSWRLPGAILNFAGDVKILNSTIAGNVTDDITDVGVGINGASVYMANSIVANGPFSDCARPVITWGHNLDADGSCGLTGAGDLPATDPMLGPLADNGGFTQTHVPPADSPAIDQIPAAKCRSAVDQRGVARPQGGLCDIGAVEFAPAAAVVKP